MSEACYTARRIIGEDAKKLILNLQLKVNERGQYQHDDAVVFTTGINRQLANIYNPEQPGKGMLLLADKNPNEVNTLKSTDLVTATNVLKKYQRLADKESKVTGMKEKPHIDTQAEAQEEADRTNYAIQATIGAKEGVAEAITEKVGTDVTDIVLRNANGTDYKNVDEWQLSDVIEAVLAGAIRPNLPDVLQQVQEPSVPTCLMCYNRLSILSTTHSTCARR
jgi:hypothetical protein